MGKHGATPGLFFQHPPTPEAGGLGEELLCVLSWGLHLAEEAALCRISGPWPASIPRAPAMSLQSSRQPEQECSDLHSHSAWAQPIRAPMGPSGFRRNQEHHQGSNSKVQGLQSSLLILGNTRTMVFSLLHTPIPARFCPIVPLLSVLPSTLRRVLCHFVSTHHPARSSCQHPDSALWALAVHWESAQICSSSCPILWGQMSEGSG